MIHHRSLHPVEVKKISVRMWSLRSEIEAALERRMKECEAAGVPLYIDDIKAFYRLDKSNPVLSEAKPEAPQEAGQESTTPEEKKADEGETPPPSETPPTPEASVADAAQNLKEAEAIVSGQQAQGVENKPNPIINRPFVRQPPDLNQISYGFSFLADINMDAVMIFTKDKFLQGQSVMVEFLIPQNFTMTAEVSYCNNYGRTSRIISETKPDYRVQCRFKYLITGERDQLRELLKSIEPSVQKPKKKEEKKVDLDSLEI
jgi:hypothetical protein